MKHVIVVLAALLAALVAGVVGLTTPKRSAQLPNVPIADRSWP